MHNSSSNPLEVLYVSSICFWLLEIDEIRGLAEKVGAFGNGASVRYADKWACLFGVGDTLTGGKSRRCDIVSMDSHAD